MLPVQCKMARVALGLGVRELAEKAQVSPDTIARLERGEALKGRTVQAVKETLEAAGILFVPSNGEGPGVRLRHWVHTEEGTCRLLFRREASELPAGDWHPARPLFALPKLAKLNENGWFVLEEPTAEQRDQAMRWYPKKE